MVTDFDKSEMLYMALKLIGYSADDIEILSVPGETVMGDEFEEFYVDNDAFYRMFLDIYYRSVDE
jgi:hypothetical protein